MGNLSSLASTKSHETVHSPYEPRTLPDASKWALEIIKGEIPKRAYSHMTKPTNYFMGGGFLSQLQVAHFYFTQVTHGYRMSHVLFELAIQQIST